MGEWLLLGAIGLSFPVGAERQGLIGGSGRVTGWQNSYPCMIEKELAEFIVAGILTGVDT
jgi:hypothetical protein